MASVLHTRGQGADGAAGRRAEPSCRPAVRPWARGPVLGEPGPPGSPAARAPPACDAAALPARRAVSPLRPEPRRAVPRCLPLSSAQTPRGAEPGPRGRNEAARGPQRPRARSGSWSGAWGLPRAIPPGPAPRSCGSWAPWFSAGVTATSLRKDTSGNPAASPAPSCLDVAERQATSFGGGGGGCAEASTPALKIPALSPALSPGPFQGYTWHPVTPVLRGPWGQATAFSLGPPCPKRVLWVKRGHLCDWQGP